MLILPVGLGTTAIVMLFNAGLWAPAIARVADTSLRYTVDKTTREILFLPLPNRRQVPRQAVHRRDDGPVGQGARRADGARPDQAVGPRADLAATELRQPHAHGALDRVRTTRQSASISRRSGAASRATTSRRPTFATLSADLQTIELLVEELAHPDERRVLHAIDLLESLEKRRLITPLLLYHQSPLVRARTLRCLEALSPEVAASWLPAVERLLADEDADVRADAVRAISTIRGPEAAHASATPPDRQRSTHGRHGRRRAQRRARSGTTSRAATAALQALANDTRETAVPGAHRGGARAR